MKAPKKGRTKRVKVYTLPGEPQNEGLHLRSLLIILKPILDRPPEEIDRNLERSKMYWSVRKYATEYHAERQGQKLVPRVIRMTEKEHLWLLRLKEHLSPHIMFGDICGAAMAYRPWTLKPKLDLVPTTFRLASATIEKIDFLRLEFTRRLCRRISRSEAIRIAFQAFMRRSNKTRTLKKYLMAYKGAGNKKTICVSLNKYDSGNRRPSCLGGVRYNRFKQIQQLIANDKAARSVLGSVARSFIITTAIMAYRPGRPGRPPNH